MAHSINETLAENQKVTDSQRKRMDELYDELYIILKEAKDRTDKSNVIKELSDIEFELQDNWNFPRNEHYHKYQYYLPDCECPRMDNLDRLGTPYKVVVKGCPYHDGV